jgi:tetratricopeptide (TPR) repeat protein
MLTIKNRGRKTGVVFLASLLWLAGCTPAGPRALLEGKRLIEEAKFPQAVEKLKVATSLLATNAQAWNYLGLACQYAGQPNEAERAYLHALKLDQDLTEAHYNLGCLWLAQKKPEAAATEFTGYTLRRPNSQEGFVKLGVAQARMGEWGAAEKSLNTALRLNRQSPEAWNTLGMVRVSRNHPAEAAQYFSNALKEQPDYGPALLNLAIVSQQSLKDRPAALQRYREYLATKPPPSSAEPVAALVRQLERELNPPPRPVATNVATSPTNASVPMPPPTNAFVAKTVPTNTSLVKVAPTNMPRTQAVALASTKPEPQSPAPKSASAAAPPQPAPKVELVRLADEPTLVAAQDVTIPGKEASPPAVEAKPPSASSAVVQPSPASTTTSESKSEKRGLFQRINPLNLFRSGTKEPARETAGTSPNVYSASESAGAVGSTDGEASVEEGAGAKPPTSRYAYLSLEKPVAGQRSEAEPVFAAAAQAQKAGRLGEAVQGYERATQLDPAFYDAYYNLGLAQTESGHLPAALRAYEHALAIRPDSLDARYNFAFVLKKQEYWQDAVEEFEKLTAAYPGEARAHLALGNLYSQQLNQPARARQHYLRVLELEPHDPQSDKIRYWLAANPP